ncbi:DUF3325 domain-containing protein [Sphingomonas sp. RB3P16]|uniref:DUF3325 domain-containing protein n=1 Tax=Parasphingomonas frigoris TaxID=3096163 RepID=UPI002FC60960
MSAACFLVATLAFTLFAFATDQHHGKRLRRPCPKGRARLLRGLAWTCLALDFVLSLRAWGGVFGPIGWVATIMAGAAAAFCALNAIPVRKSMAR